jgi:uncharacterized OB-fold protein
MLERAGIVKTEKKKKSEALKAEQCQHCFTINRPGSRFCDTCGRPMTKEVELVVQATSQQVQSLFVENPNALVIFQELLTQLKK